MNSTMLNVSQTITQLNQRILHLNQQLGLYKTLMFIPIAIAVVFLVWALYLNYKYKYKLQRLIKKGYKAIHLISPGRIKTYMMKHSDLYRIENQIYYGDPAHDVIEEDTGLRHAFFFENEPFQIAFIPSGVKVTLPESAPPALKKAFESRAPKIIVLKSPISARALDEYLNKAVAFGKVLSNLGRNPLSWLNKNTGIGILIAVLAIIILISALTNKK